MKKNIFALIALAVAFVGCSKEASETPSPAAEGQKFVITASVGDPATRLGYVENDQNGFTAKFTSSEKISLYFLKADNSVALSRVLNIDGYSISDDGRTAKFETTDLVIPTDAVKLAAYLYSGSGSTYTEEKATTDLSLQANLGAAQSHHILYTTLNTSDIKVDENGVSTANIKFAYKTALLRFTLTFPEDVKVTMDNKTVITLTNANSTVHNALDIVWGELAESSTKGDIVFYPTDTLGKKNVAVAYACVWAGDNFKGSKLSMVQGADTYSVDLELKKETLEAGKVYDVARTITNVVKPVTMWTNDEAGSVEFKYSGGEEVTSDWLSCKDGKVSWTTNTTGSIRNAKLTFKNGSSFEMWQADPKDLVATFAGAYTLAGDVRTPTKGGAAAQATADDQTGVKYGTLGGVTKGSWYDQAWTADGKGTSIDITLEAAEGEHIMCAKGIYENLVMPVDLLIDYEKQTFGMNFVIENKAYPITSGMYAGLGQYAAFATELMEGSNWCLGFGNGGAFNYYGSVDLSTGNIIVKFAKGQTCTAYNQYNVVGILVNRYASESTAGTALIRSQKSAYAAKNIKLSGAAYARVIQNDFTITKK